MEHQGKLLWKQGYDCTISKKQRNQYHSISPDPLSCKEAIRRANYQSYYWLHCNDKIVSQLSLTCYRWNYNEQLNMVVSVWFDWPQFLPLIIKKKKSKNKTTVDGYKADLQNAENILPPASKKPRIQLIMTNCHRSIRKTVYINFFKF